MPTKSKLEHSSLLSENPDLSCGSKPVFLCSESLLHYCQLETTYHMAVGDFTSEFLVWLWEGFTQDRKSLVKYFDRDSRFVSVS